MHTAHAAIITGLLLATTGCTNFFLRGASPASRPPANAVATFTAPRCTLAGSGEDIAGPTGTYQLAPGAKGFVLYELDGAGQGAQIENYWRDEKGHNFVTYVRSSHGWHYVIPDQRGAKGKRYVYSAGAYQPVKNGHVTTLQGTPSASCDLIPQDAPARDVPAQADEAASGPAAAAESDPPPASAAPAASAPTAPTAPAPVCAAGATQECVGAGACRGGQTCAPDGSGWGPCDCGAD